MKRKTFCLVLTIFCAAIANFSQEKIQTAPTPPPVQETDDVIRISSKLVLVDALVLDKEGKQITNLTADDFEVFQDGKRQEIKNFSYINGKNEISNQPSGKNSLPVPPFSVRSDQGRTITFVIDDGNCLASPEGLALAKDGVKKFIDEQMLPDDKVAIYRTRGGSSLMQIYTSNKEVLKNVIKKVRWFPSGCGSAFDATRNDSTAKILTGEGSRTFDSNETRQFKADAANLDRNNQVRGSFGVLGFVIDRLKTLPQRKIVFFVSEGIPINFEDDTILYALKEITDKASRASVVFYTISEKGLTNPGMFEAQDEVSGDALREARIEEERSLNHGLSYLAEQTGGKFIRNKSFIAPEIEKILGQESGYYLLGYEPDEGTFNGKDFHKIEVKLKRDDLKISSRKGFYGREEKESRPQYKKPDSPLYQAIASPFQENEIDLRLTTLVGNDAREGNYIRALFHINGKDLTFTDEADGMKKTVLDIVAVTMDEKGKIIEEFNRTYPIRIPARGLATVARNGLDYSTDIPIKKPGYYSFRLAVRDEKSGHLGSSSDYVQIPDVKKDEFFISGLITTDIGENNKPMFPKSRPVDAAFALVFSNTIASIRQYEAEIPFAYVYQIYNAKLDKAAKKPKLTTRYRLFKDGKLLSETQEKTVEVEDQTDLSRIQDYGFLRLNEASQPGEYFLQLIVKDLIADKISTQWINFEIVE